MAADTATLSTEDYADLELAYNALMAPAYEQAAAALVARISKGAPNRTPAAIIIANL